MFNIIITEIYFSYFKYVYITQSAMSEMEDKIMRQKKKKKKEPKC